MQVRLLLAALSVHVAALAWSAPARPQVTDAERAVARQLFKEGDELQQAKKWSDALDKFQRAERAYSAPTNVLRVAECQAALGQLVESAESYRRTVRMPLPPGSPQAFQAAVDQARRELAQVEPRVPKLIVQVAPATAAGAQLQIDGQSVSAALIGEGIPLDPGTHRVRVVAREFANSEQDALLKERETTTVVATLKPLTGTATMPFPSPAAPALATPPPPNELSGPPPSAPPTYAVPPPPPAAADTALSRERGSSGAGLLLGGHIGLEGGGGKLPIGDSLVINTNLVAAAGLAFGIEGGLRFARHWYVGLMIDHAEMTHGDLSELPGLTAAASSTSLVAAFIGFIGNPDRLSFYGELGAGTRSLTVHETLDGGQETSTSYQSAEFALGVGLWVPVGRSFRVVPKLTLGFGSFDPGAEAHTFAMLGASGFYNLDF